VHATPLNGLALRDGMAEVPRSLPDADRLAAQPAVLTHYDYWSGNVLWQGGTISAVIDWSGGCRAPRGYDVSWCRLDLVLLHDHAVAQTFLAAYEHATGQPVPDIHRWDLLVTTNSHDVVETWLPNYTSLGRTDLTTATLRERHTRWAEHSLANS
jgi:Ser/Thr protein kinase RdoA (MazF antagonist)